MSLHLNKEKIVVNTKKLHINNRDDVIFKSGSYHSFAVLKLNFKAIERIDQIFGQNRFILF